MNILIRNYINRLTIDDLNTLALKNNINFNNDELNFTYNYIKKNWELMLSNPNLFIIDKYKDYYSLENFNKLKKLYNKYFTKYYKYL